MDADEAARRRGDYARHRQQEFAALAEAFSQRLREGSLTPDDARAWTVIVLHQAAVIGLRAGSDATCD